jgi:amino acid transporter
VENKNGLGTVQGVFVPCMLSIIGVVLFLRLGWAIGEVGVLGVLAMIAFGTLLILLTVLSLCALATNGKIRGGGAYYLISRSLGPEFGGAIGVIFFAANSVGIAFYMQGFSDTMAAILGLQPGEHSTFLLKLAMACACLGLETLIAIVGSGLYAKVALLIFLVQMGSIFTGAVSIWARGEHPFSWEGFPGKDCPEDTGSMADMRHNYSYVGPSFEQLHSNLLPPPGADYAKVFKTIFPALTGIMAGANMSGVLKRPEIAIPKGELWAILCSMSTYVLVVILLGSSVPRETLQNQYQILSIVTFPGTGPSVILTIGVIASTTSSALASIQSASRVIQALAEDNLIPFLRPLARECNGEPVAGILASVVIAVLLLCVGSLDAIAPILTMFFLLTYALTNMACFVHRVSGHPNFRPQFRYFSWHTAIVGAVLCFAVMWYLEWLYSVVSISILTMIAIYIARRPEEEKGGWGDVSQSLIFHQVRKYLLRLDTRGAHVKYWRPQFMVVVQGGPYGNVPALEFVDNLKKGGLFVVGDTVSISPSGGGGGAGASQKAAYQRYHDRRALWSTFLEEARFKAFVEIVLQPPGCARLGVANLAMSTGIGGLKPNTLVLLFPEEEVQSASPRDHEPAMRTVPQREQHRSFDSLGELLSNSVYDASASNGCRVTCAANRDLWWTTFTEPGGPTAASLEPGSHQEYVGMLQDALDARMHFLVLRAMGDLDKHAIANRLGKFSPESQNAWLAEQTAEERSRRKARRETLNPFVAKTPVQIDVWVFPWTNMADLMLQCQLSFMLSRDDFWTQHSYIRVCSVVAAFSEIGGDAQNDHITAKERRTQLYNEVWWKMRIPATIEVFDAVEVVGAETWAASCAAAKAAQATTSAGAGGHSDGHTAQLYSILNLVIRQQNFNTAVSIVSMPDVPTQLDTADTEGTGIGAELYMAGLQALTSGIGPVMLTKAQADSSVITTEL